MNKVSLLQRHRGGRGCSHRLNLPIFFVGIAHGSGPLFKAVADAHAMTALWRMVLMSIAVMADHLPLPRGTTIPLDRTGQHFDHPRLLPLTVAVLSLKTRQALLLDSITHTAWLTHLSAVH